MPGGKRRKSPQAAPPPTPPTPLSSETPSAVAAEPQRVMSTLPAIADAPEPSEGALPAWINRWGVISFSLACAALLLGALAFGWYLSLALCGLGLGLCLLGYLETLDQRQTKDRVWLSLGGTASAAVLLVMLFKPEWLNDEWSLDSAVAEPDRNQQTQVSSDNKKSLRELSPGDWVDAQHHAIRQYDVLIRVERVAVDRLPGQDGDQSFGPATLITLHIGNVGMERMLIYRGAAQAGQSVGLRDDRGQPLAVRKLGARAKKAGQVAKVSLLPQSQVRDLLVFEPPPAGAAYLELEVPAAAWGRQGVCKFKIPGSWIQVRKPNR